MGPGKFSGREDKGGIFQPRGPWWVSGASPAGSNDWPLPCLGQLLNQNQPPPPLPLYCFHLPFPRWLRLTFNKHCFCAELPMTYCRVSSSPGQAASPAPGRTAACKGKLHFDLHSPFLFSVTWLWRQKEENNVFSPTPPHPRLPLDYALCPLLSFFPLS